MRLEPRLSLSIGRAIATEDTFGCASRELCGVLGLYCVGLIENEVRYWLWVAD
jgi:hypothetical protein